MIAPACGWQNTRKQKPRPMLAASPRTPPRLRYAGSAEFSLMAHA